MNKTKDKFEWDAVQFKVTAGSISHSTQASYKYNLYI